MIKEKYRGWLYVLMLIIPYILFVGGFSFLESVVMGIPFLQTDLNPATPSFFEQFISQGFDFMGTIAVLWLFMRFVDQRPFMELGFYLEGRFKEILIGIVLGLGIMLSGFLILEFAGEVNFGYTDFDLSGILISIGLFILVAIGEEVLLRGYVLRNFMISFNKYVALVASSLLFSLMHAGNPNVDLFGLTVIFLAGILLGISYIHTKNLWFPIALHLSWNLFQSFVGFNVSGQDFYSIIEFTIPDQNVWNGGAFGFEGSVLSVIAEVICIAGIGIYYARRKK